MADGTLRISFDIEPMHAQDAFRLFAAPGTPAAIAALQVGYAAATVDKAATVEKPKGGPLAKLAGMWCNDPEFFAWLTASHKRTTCAVEAKEILYEICGIASRAELDNDLIAADKFHRLIRGPYSKHLMARGIVA
jgi:hypothetical protein